MWKTIGIKVLHGDVFKYILKRIPWSLFNLVYFSVYQKSGDAPGVGSRETTPGHSRRGSVDGEQWVAHRPYVY